jgi:predicted amidohydrolase
MHSPDALPLRLAIAQTAPALRDPVANAAMIARAAAGSDVDLVVTPELSLTGYDVGDAVYGLSRPVTTGSSLAAAGPLAGVDGLVVAGLIEAGHGGPYNTAAVLSRGTVVFRHRKLYLPTYGMFDEGRFFGRGDTLDVWHPAPGWSSGLLICEDFWHPALTYVLASRGIDLLIVQAAAPGRGVWQGGEHGAFASMDIWERLARTAAQVYGIYVALANRVGVEGGITFAGGSLVVGPDGEVLARAGDDGTDFLRVDLSRRALEAARRPYWHARDDDPGLVLRELARHAETR